MSEINRTAITINPFWTVCAGRQCAWLNGVKWMVLKFSHIYKESKLIKRGTKKIKSKTKEEKFQKKKNIHENLCIISYSPHNNFFSSKYQNSQNFPHYIFLALSIIYLFFIFYFSYSKFIFFKGVSHHITAADNTLIIYGFFCVCCEAFLNLLDRQIYWNIFGAYYVMRMTIIVAIFRGSSK